MDESQNSFVDVNPEGLLFYVTNQWEGGGSEVDVVLDDDASGFSSAFVRCQRDLLRTTKLAKQEFCRSRGIYGALVHCK